MRDYLKLVVLLALAGHCMGSCNNNHVLRSKRCLKLVRLFEKALVEQELNVFSLQQNFFPSNQRPTSSFSVGYLMVFTAQDGNITGVLRYRGWCKSSVHTIASPQMIQTLFSGLFSAFNQLTGHSILFLNLTEKSIDGGFTTEDIDYALDHLTPWLRAYTKNQGLTYNEKDKGYMCEIVSFNYFPALGASIFSITCPIVAALVAIVFFKSLKSQSKSQSKSKRLKAKLTILAAVSNIASIVNCIVLGLCIYEAHLYFTHEQETDLTIRPELREKFTITYKHKLMKVSEVIAGIGIFFLAGSAGAYYGKSLPPPPSFLLCCEPRRIIYFWYFGNWFALTYWIGLNIVPVFMMLFVAPIETLSELIFFVSLFSSMVMTTSVLISYTKIYRLNQKKPCSYWCKFSIKIFSMALIFLALLFLSIVYVSIVGSTTSDEASSFVPVIVSFVLSTIPLTVGYLAKRFLTKKAEINQGGKKVIETTV